MPRAIHNFTSTPRIKYHVERIVDGEADSAVRVPSFRIDVHPPFANNSIRRRGNLKSRITSVIVAKQSLDSPTLQREIFCAEVFELSLAKYFNGIDELNIAVCAF